MKRLLIILSCVAFLAVSTAAFAETVYVTKNGKKYHKEDCRWTQNKKAVAIEEDEAIAKGLTPCGRCFKSDETSKKNDEKVKEVSSDKSDQKETKKKKS